MKISSKRAIVSVSLIICVISAISPYILVQLDDSRGNISAKILGATPLLTSCQIEKKTTSPLTVNPSIPTDMGINLLHSSGFKGENITIAVLDSGVDSTDTRFDRDGNPITTNDKVINRTVSFIDYEGLDDENGHGTMVTGLIGARYTSTGVYSMGGIAPECTIWHIKVLDEYGEGTDETIAEGLQYCLAHADEIDIISMSLGIVNMRLYDVETLIKQCWDAGIVVVAAGGNEGAYDEYSLPDFYTVNSPSTALEAISVGATVDGDYLAYFSSNGPSPETFEYKPEIVAPGTSIVSTTNEGGLGSASGTSLSTPIVAAAIADILSGLDYRPTPDSIKSALLDSCTLLGYEDPYMEGNGLPDFYQAWWDLTRPDYDNISVVPKQISFPNIFDSEAEFSPVYTYPYLKATVVIGESLSESLQVSVSENIKKFVKIVELHDMQNQGQYILGIDFVEAEFVFTQPGTYFGNITLFTSGEIHEIIDIQLTVSLLAMIKKSGIYITLIIISSTSIALVTAKYAIKKSKNTALQQCEEGWICECDEYGENCVKIRKKTDD